MFESRRPDASPFAPEPARQGTTLVVGTRQTSAASLRAWLAVDMARRPFDVVELDSFAADHAERAREVSPTGRLPVLSTAGTLIWGSLAIMEWAAELAPELWPAEFRRRAVARSVLAEVDGGFSALDRALPMDWFAHYPVAHALPAEVVADLERIQGLWHDCLAQTVADGFLFGPTPVLADLACVPLASRLVTYGLVPEEPRLAAYVERLVSLPAIARWFRDAVAAPVLPNRPAIADGAPQATEPLPVTAPLLPTRPTIAEGAPQAARPLPAATVVPQPPAPLPAGPRRLEEVVARARFKGASQPGALPPSPAAPAVPARRGPQEPPPAALDEPRDGPGLPWLRRRAPGAAPAARRRPPTRE